MAWIDETFFGSQPETVGPFQRFAYTLAGNEAGLREIEDDYKRKAIARIDPNSDSALAQLAAITGDPTVLNKASEQSAMRRYAQAMMGQMPSEITEGIRQGVVEPRDALSLLATAQSNANKLSQDEARQRSLEAYRNAKLAQDRELAQQRLQSNSNNGSGGTALEQQVEYLVKSGVPRMKAVALVSGLLQKGATLDEQGNIVAAEGFSDVVAGNAGAVANAREQAQADARLMPPAVIKITDDAAKSYQESDSVIKEANELASFVKNNKLDLGPLDNIVAKASSTLGKSTENSQYIARLERFKERVRNAALIAAKGTQTEGDAVRALKERFTSQNDNEITLQELESISTLFGDWASAQQARVNMAYQPYLGGGEEPPLLANVFEKAREQPKRDNGGLNDERAQTNDPGIAVDGGQATNGAAPAAGAGGGNVAGGGWKNIGGGVEYRIKKQ